MNHDDSVDSFSLAFYIKQSLDKRLSEAAWDQDFLALARWWALRRSKDPSTKVGAVIVRPDHSIVSLGYNGFAKGVSDDPERYLDRELKHKIVVHAERNAMHFSSESLRGCTLYTWPFMPCASCSGDVIQRGITRVVAPPIPTHLQERWGENMELATMQFREAGVKLDIVELKPDEEPQI